MDVRHRGAFAVLTNTISARTDATRRAMAEFSGNNPQPNSDGAWEISTGRNSSAGAHSKGDMKELAKLAWSRVATRGIDCTRRCRSTQRWPSRGQLFKIKRDSQLCNHPIGKIGGGCGAGIRH